ncbi:S8 family peptidase [Qipengyuania sp. JC766]|uniref:S8 family peptidase n=1 Tax=Qipengyuania sp. JC766 TaxID=3232139 RepID=UPI00345A8589
MRSGFSGKRIWLAGAAGTVLALAGCSGGSGGSAPPITTPPAQPSPTPSPTPTPTPSPTPPPTNFNTAEFRRSTGPDFHNAVTAWQQGFAGAGSTIAIIDTGIDLDSPEFAGRILSSSADVAGSRTAEGEDDHGTNVALIAAAARDNTGIVGIAYQASILALRADRPGSCATETDETLDGCVFRDADIAAGIDRAIAANATVINLSLGGGPPSQSLRSAIARAANAGIVLVVAAGNDGDSTEQGIDPDQPDPFAAGLSAVAGSQAIIVGSVDDGGLISGFSNRAGSLAGTYLTARGERLCCVYEDGVLRVTTDENGDRFVTLISGTSFATPQVAGAVALLKQAFPNLTGRQIVEILLDTARDAGDAGTDPIYGRGVLDIARAFSPSGQTALAGTQTVVRISDDSGVGSAPMGDALDQAALDTVITDKYDRAFGFRAGDRLRGANQRQHLRAAIESNGRRVVASGGPVSLAFTIGDTGMPDQIAELRLTGEQAEQAPFLAGRVAVRLDASADIALGISESAQGLVAQLQGHDRPAFLIARDSRGDTGFGRSEDMSLAFRKSFGEWGLSVSADRGDAWLGALRNTGANLSRHTERYATESLGITADRRFGPVAASLGATWLREERTILGGYFSDAFGAGGSDTVFLDAGATFDAGDRWRFGGAMRVGRTSARQVGLVEAGSDLSSMAWSLDAVRADVFGSGDTLGLRLSQPLRVESGGLLLDLPISYDYASRSAVFGIQELSLAPDGREMMGELAWQGWLLGGDASASLFYRSEPGHIAGAPDDAGIALRWNRRF